MREYTTFDARLFSGSTEANSQMLVLPCEVGSGCAKLYIIHLLSPSRRGRLLVDIALRNMISDDDMRDTAAHVERVLAAIRQNSKAARRRFAQGSSQNRPTA